MQWWTLVLLLCAGAARGQEEAEEWRTVNTAQGPVRGRRDSSGEFYTFFNIPYATAPTGRDRFKAPLPAPVWFQPLDAVDQRIICPQVSIMAAGMKMQENCLVANVFVPDTEETDLPVLVYVHGGAYQMGYGNMLRFTHVVRSKKVIIVNFNYRLGIHGFLCLGTRDVPGNAGMKDQVALLRWVNRNIAGFGGNPEDVTIAGYSAGSSSVDLLMLSKTVEGLFNKVIPESGSNMAAYSIQSDPVENAKMYARRLNFTEVDDVYALEEFYRTMSYELLTLDAHGDRPDSTFLFSPCVERDTGEEVFLSDSPLNILKSGDYNKLPMLYGFTNMEGLLRVGLFEYWRHRMNEKFSDFLPADLIFDNDDQREQVAMQVKEFYFGDNPVQENNILGYVDFFTDVIFIHPKLWAVKLHVEAGHDQVYLYEYSFVDEDTPVVPYTNITGADHSAQTMALGDGRDMTQQLIDESLLSPEYQEMKAIVREIWLNFVITGKPVPDGSSLPSWPATGAAGSPHMSLGQLVELRAQTPEQERTQFWEDIYDLHYRPPLAATGAAHSTYFSANLIVTFSTIALLYSNGIIGL